VTGLHRTMSAVTSRDVMRGMPSGLAVTGTKVTAHYGDDYCGPTFEVCLQTNERAAVDVV